MRDLPFLSFFIGTASHAAYAVLIPRLRRGEPLYATTLGVVTAATLTLVVIFWPRLAETDWAAVATYVWVVIAYLAVMAISVIVTEPSSRFCPGW